MLRFLIATLVTLPLYLGNSVGHAQTVIEILKKQNNPKTVNPTFIHPSAHMLLIIGEQKVFLDRSKILALIRQQKTLTSAFNMSNFRILNEYSTGNVLSVIYSYDYKLKTGAATTSGTNLVHEVLIKTPGGFKELFIVQQQ